LLIGDRALRLRNLAAKRLNVIFRMGDKAGGMRRIVAKIVVRVVLMAGAALALSACGFADMRAPLPEFMRAKAPDPMPPEPPPDVKRLMRENLEQVFTAASHAEHVRVSTPRREPSGLNWTACVKADLNSVMGKPLGSQTYRLTISGNTIIDRRRVEDDDNCASETYEPV
jgi:hypothetical protein